VFVIGSPEFTSQARTAMNSASACHLVGSALDTTGASELSRSQVALIDSRGGGRRNGAEVARALQKLSPGCAPVIVLQKVSAQSARWVYEEQATSWSLITLKAMSDPGQLDMAVNSAARGMPWVQPDIRSAVERHVADRVEEFPRSNRRGSTVESLWSGRVSQLVPGMPDHSELRPVNTNSRAYSPDALD
jgi:DNA-binding NarL/FixJ family response regulator